MWLACYFALISVGVNAKPSIHLSRTVVLRRSDLDTCKGLGGPEYFMVDP